MCRELSKSMVQIERKSDDLISWLKIKLKFMLNVK